MQLTERNSASYPSVIGFGFIISQQIIQLLLESPCRTSRVEYSRPVSLACSFCAPLVWISDRRISKRKTNSSGRCSSLAARESSVEIFLARPFRALSARFHFSHSLIRARGPRCKALALHSAICYHPLSIYRRAIDSCVISRPIINKSVAFIVAHSRRALHLQHFHDRTRERAVSEQERLGLGEKRDAFHCVQNREEHRPAIRNSSGTVSSSIPSAQEANDFSRWKPGRAGWPSCSVHQASSFSLSIDLYVPIYLLSLPSHI